MRHPKGGEIFVRGNLHAVRAMSGVLIGENGRVIPKLEKFQISRRLEIEHRPNLLRECSRNQQQTETGDDGEGAGRIHILVIRNDPFSVALPVLPDAARRLNKTGRD
jgi:hypothetical protein